MGITDRYRSLADLPAQLPMFPLQGCILLPRSNLPLNIFEPRYLSMVDDVIAGNRIIGIVQPLGSEEKSPDVEGASASSNRLRGEAFCLFRNRGWAASHYPDWHLPL